MHRTSQEEWEERIKKFEADSFRIIIMHIVYIASAFGLIMYYGLLTNTTLIVLSSIFFGWIITEVHLTVMRSIDEDTRQTFENFEIVIKEIEKDDL